MPDVVPYALLYQHNADGHDPTNSVWISWIDVGNDAGSEQTVHYGEDPDDLSQSESDSGTSIPAGSGEYVYHTLLTGLDEDTTYHLEIESSDTVTRTVSTLPENQPDEFVIAQCSDYHPWRSGIGMDSVGAGGEIMENFAEASDYDIILEPGDWPTHTQSPSSSDTSNWIQWFQEYAYPLDKDHLHQRYQCSGNHEVADIVGNTWNGSKSDWDYDDLTPDAGYYQTFFPNLKESDTKPSDIHSSLDDLWNAGHVEVGDWLQLIALPTYDGFPEDFTDWFDDVIDPSVTHCIPFFHSAMLPAGERGGSSHAELMDTMRREWVPIIANAENVNLTYCGNEHARKVTWPWYVVDEEPSGSHGDDYFELGGGEYMVFDIGNDDPNEESGDRVTGFGDGWPNARDGEGYWGNWMHKIGEYDGDTQQITDVQIDRDATVSVTEYDQDGDEMDQHLVYDGEEPGLEDGEIRAGNTLVVEAEIENIGTESGIQDITLERNGTTEDSVPDVSLESGESEGVVLRWETESGDEGEWTIYIESDDEYATIDIEVV